MNKEKKRYTLWLLPRHIAMLKKKSDDKKKGKGELNGSEWVRFLIDENK